MSKLLQNPAVVSLCALLASVMGGLLPFWRAGGKLMAKAVLSHRQAPIAGKAQGWEFWTIEVDNLSSELTEEKAQLVKQSQLLDQRAARIAGERREMEKDRAKIEAMRQEVGDRVIEIQGDEGKNLRVLAQTYANLSPKAAVAIIREMEDVTVVKILSLMKPDVVAPIFEEMSKTPDKDGFLTRRAAVISEKLRLMKPTKPPAS